MKEAYWIAQIILKVMAVVAHALAFIGMFVAWFMLKDHDLTLKLFIFLMGINVGSAAEKKLKF